MWSRECLPLSSHKLLLHRRQRKSLPLWKVALVPRSRNQRDGQQPCRAQDHTIASIERPYRAPAPRDERADVANKRNEAPQQHRRRADLHGEERRGDVVEEPLERRREERRAFGRLHGLAVEDP